MTDAKPEHPGPENDVQEAVEEIITDPDSPDKGHTSPPPQTIDAEPARPDKDAR